MKRTIQQKTCLCFLVKPEPCLSLSDARTDDDMPDAAVCTLIITDETIHDGKERKKNPHILLLKKSRICLLLRCW